MPDHALLDAVGDGARVVTDAEAQRLFDLLGDVDDDALSARAATVPHAPTGDRQTALRTVISSLDLTSLHATDDESTVVRLCRRARTPDPRDADVPSAAAVCVTPDLVGVAARELAGSDVRAACVAAGFPSGRTFASVKLAEIRAALDAGADELDVVIDRAAVLGGRHAAVLEELRSFREACDEASTRERPRHLKVILEVAELGTSTIVRRAAWLALLAGADVVKTATGTSTRPTSPEDVLLLCEVVDEFAGVTGSMRGVKAAGGVREPRQALRLLALAHAVGGDAALTRFRIGASGLLDGVLAALRERRPA